MSDTGSPEPLVLCCRQLLRWIVFLCCYQLLRWIGFFLLSATSQMNCYFSCYQLLRLIVILCCNQIFFGHQILRWITILRWISHRISYRFFLLIDHLPNKITFLWRFHMLTESIQQTTINLYTWQGNVSIKTIICFYILFIFIIPY